VSPIASRTEAVNWLVKRLAQDGPGLWTDRQRQELAEKLAQDYRPGGPKWRVKEWTERPEGISVYVVTRGGEIGIHRVDDRDKTVDKAEAIARALNALDLEMPKSSQAG
jgi:hypothetical protein